MLVSAEPKVQGQVQKPQSGPNPNVKLVSGRPRCRSHSPRCRLDVDVGPEGQAGGRIGLGPVSCQEGLLVPPAWEVTSPDSDPLSKSFPPLQPSTKRHSYALAHNSADCLRLPTDLQRSVSSEYLKSTGWDADLSLVSSGDSCPSMALLSHFSPIICAPRLFVPIQIPSQLLI